MSNVNTIVGIDVQKLQHRLATTADDNLR